MKQLALILVLLVFSSCDPESAGRQPSATGKSGELLVVMDSFLWNREAGDAVKSVFADNMVMYPQPEPKFNLIQIDKQGFTSLFENHRHIFIAEINPDIDKVRIEGGRDVYSYPQTVIKIIAPNSDAFAKTVKANAQRFIDRYLEAEWERTINANKRIINHSIVNALRDNFGFSMAVSQGYYIATQTENFMWIRRTGVKEDLDMGLLISVLPYKSAERDFAEETIWARRDSITKLYIPGPLPDTYMTTYPDIPPVFREINFKDKYAVETRGLWRTEGYMMGGPFVNYTMVDEKGENILIFDAFVFYPNKNKRDFMRQLQALVYSIEFVEE